MITIGQRNRINSNIHIHKPSIKQSLTLSKECYDPFFAVYIYDAAVVGVIGVCQHATD